ncbi:MAG TPA: exodeoxyribonuclease VII large subunit [Candidatus Binataceae bacterium]|nr:exodeoxyribonuclease VII large subunit [Candidatus Binataceae bacterium]
MDGQLELSLGAARRQPLNVTQLVRAVRDVLEAGLGEYWVVGEISNARLAPSKHLYFTLKDARSAVSGVMFASAHRRLRFRVEDGMEVIVRGRVNLYEARGTLQFYAEEMEPRGAGALQVAFEQLKRRLGDEGLFDQARKRPIPFMPRAVGIVTALGGAAVRDMLRILLDRYPNSHVIVRSVRVQGAGSAEEIAGAIADLNQDGRAEVIIVGRGGGSLEDLWAFNEEAVARAINRSKIPIVSAVGHEIDYTIADFAADLRAPTPTAAAQMVVPEKAELLRQLGENRRRLGAAMIGVIDGERRQVEHYGARLRDPRSLIRQVRQRADEAGAALAAAIEGRLGDARRHCGELAARLRSPLGLARERRLQIARVAIGLARALDARVAPMRLALAALAPRLNAALGLIAADRRNRLHGAMQRLDDVSPLKVLERGYAVVVNRRDNRAVTDAAAVAINDELDIRLKRGRLAARTVAREI